MTRTRLTRRQYGTVLATGFGAAIAGCIGSGPGGDDDESETSDGAESETDESGPSQEEIEAEYGPIGELTIVLENEDGEPVSSGVEILVTHDEESIGHGITEGIVDGEVTVEILETGPYTVRVESLTDEFESVEEGVLIEGDESVMVVLEGASPSTGDEAEAGDDGDDDDADDGDDDDADEDE